MDFIQNNYYHIFNRGNNSQKVFFNRENYLFFLRKIKKQIQPFVSIIAWCLMPTHFHLLVFINHEKLLKENIGNHENVRSGRYQTFNQSLGVLLSSYTKAIQNQEKITGSLFQKRTKAKLMYDEIEIEPSYWNTTFGTVINISEGKSYLETCIEYIHHNPVYSGLVKNPEDWEFSSMRDFLGLRQGKLIDYGLLEKENLIIRGHTKGNGINVNIETTDRQVETRHPNFSRETSNIVIIGIGSNINAEANISKMLEMLKGKVEVVKVSAMIKTRPIGIENQPDYTNGAVKINTVLNQSDLNILLKSIEDKMGRDRTAPKFGPRNIDLDIVVWNGEIVDNDYYTRDFIQKSVDEIS
jgi:putative transposase